MEMVSDNQRMAGGILEMAKERDSLKAKVEEMAACLVQLTEDKVEIRVERDSLKAAKAVVDEQHAECCAYSGKLREERDSLRKKLLKAELSIESLINERDFLRGKVDGFSSEIGIFAKELQATCQVLIDQCTKAGGGIS